MSTMSSRYASANGSISGHITETSALWHVAGAVLWPKGIIFHCSSHRPGTGCALLTLFLHWYLPVSPLRSSVLMKIASQSWFKMWSSVPDKHPALNAHLAVCSLCIVYTVLFFLGLRLVGWEGSMSPCDNSSSTCSLIMACVAGFRG